MASLNAVLFFLLDILDEIWDVTESVSEGFLIYSSIAYMINTSIAFTKSLVYA